MFDYFHCFAHRLNHVLEHRAENIPTEKPIFETVGDIFRFMEGSTRQNILREHERKGNYFWENPLCSHSLLQDDRVVQIIWIVLLTFAQRFCQCFSRCPLKAKMAKLLVCWLELNNLTL